MPQRRQVLFSVRVSALRDLDNGIIGSPTVACEREFIRFSVPTRKPFRGRVYVKGEYGKDECVRNYVSGTYEPIGLKITRGQGRHPGSHEAGGSVGVEHQPPYSRARPPGGHESPRFPESGRRWKEYFGGDRATRVRPDVNGECPLTCPPCEECRDSAVWRAVGPRTRRQAEDNEAAIEIQLGTCNLRRDRTANPPGIQMSLTVVVSFHDSFITRVDRAYQVVCAYEEHEHTVTYKMDIENPPEQNLGGEGVLPRCEYRITAPSGRGQIANVRVGDQVEHTWRCATDFAPPEGLSDKYGVLVHSCYLEDGNGRRELILNDKGCTLQPAVMGTPAYSKRSLEASVSTLVVKFPDRDFVGFQCTISVCMKEIGNCEGVTPPRCEGSEALTSSRPRRSVKTNDWQLHSQTLTVLDPPGDDDSSALDFERVRALAQTQHQEDDVSILAAFSSSDFCVSVMSFGVLVASSTFFVTVSAAMIITSVLLGNPFTKQAKCSDRL